ncbi:nuclear transport factor 2 family protein [Leeia aquatica]|uniref:Nuclear transport factor 2 family protein n=1 Tax=Leeia aquatica TaxID=2725557 RepID=A0A847S2M1_9NEIS|nr:nuclear transport factor 2 family protein [Leeia aquatica]NLR74033.1 nuclear transport factor 2 family protein [Leeia aquatica]
MESIDQNQYRDVWEGYCAVWRPQSAVQRREQFSRVLSQQCIYRDPLTQCQGWDELSAYIEDFQRQFPGCYFVTAWFHTHHARAAVRWHMCGPDGSALSEGVSYVEFDGEGKLISMNGFFETGAP